MRTTLNSNWYHSMLFRMITFYCILPLSIIQSVAYTFAPKNHRYNWQKGVLSSCFCQYLNNCVINNLVINNSCFVHNQHFHRHVSENYLVFPIISKKTEKLGHAMFSAIVSFINQVVKLSLLPCTLNF